MEYPLNIYITAHTLISSLGFGIPENLEAIHNYRSGIRMQEAGRRRRLRAAPARAVATIATIQATAEPILIRVFTSFWHSLQV